MTRDVGDSGDRRAARHRFPSRFIPFEACKEASCGEARRYNGHGKYTKCIFRLFLEILWEQPDQNLIYGKEH
jgi:hypothetical protein